MGIFRDVTITWRGKEYTVTPSMRLMRTIEIGVVSFSDIAVRTSRGYPPVSHIAYVISKMLETAGVSASEEEVYLELVNGDAAAVSALIGTVLNSFNPQLETSKNPAAQTAHPQAARAAKKAGR